MIANDKKGSTKRFFAGLFLGALLTAFAMLVGWPPFFGTIKTAALKVLVSVLCGLAFCSLFYELDQHSGKDFLAGIRNNASRRWFWWGFLVALVDGILILGAVLISLFVLKQIPSLQGQSVLILASVVVLCIVLIPAATLLIIRSKLMSI